MLPAGRSTDCLALVRSSLCSHCGGAQFRADFIQNASTCTLFRCPHSTGCCVDHCCERSASAYLQTWNQPQQQPITHATVNPNELAINSVYEQLSNTAQELKEFRATLIVISICMLTMLITGAIIGARRYYKKRQKRTITDGLTAESGSESSADGGEWRDNFFQLLRRVIGIRRLSTASSTNATINSNQVNNDILLAY